MTIKLKKKQIYITYLVTIICHKRTDVTFSKYKFVFLNVIVIKKH